MLFLKLPFQAEMLIIFWFQLKTEKLKTLLVLSFKPWIRQGQYGLNVKDYFMNMVLTLMLLISIILASLA